jgi:isoflavone 2'-hydroxylase
MTPFFNYTLITIISLLTLKFLLIITKKLKNLPPGPTSIPIIGNIHQLKHPLHRTLYNLSQKYGQVFSLRFGSRLVVVVSSPSTVHECFTKNDTILANRPPLLAGKHIGYNYTAVTVAPYGDHWRNVRRIISLDVLSTHRLNSFLGIRKDEIIRLLQSLTRSSRDGFAKVELKSKFSEMTFNTIMRMISGKRYYGEDCDVRDEEEAKEFRELITEMISVGGSSNPGEFVGIFRWFDYGDYEKKLKRISRRFDGFLQGLIDEHRRKKKNVNTMIDHLLNLQESQPEYYTDQIIKGIVLVTMQFFLYLLWYLNF